MLLFYNFLTGGVLPMRGTPPFFHIMWKGKS